MLCNGGRACALSLLLIQRTDQQLWNTLFFIFKKTTTDGGDSVLSSF